MEKQSEKKVLPGDFIATEEEFEAGKDTFEENGDIRSAAIGKVVENTARHTVSVQKPFVLESARRGDLVYAEVFLVRDNSVIVALLKDPDAKEKRVSPFGRAAIPIRMVSRDYVENLRALFKVGDIVKAKIAAIHADCMDLKTDEPDLGVVKAFCSVCRAPLEKFGETFKCTECGSNEERKASTEYGA